MHIHTSVVDSRTGKNIYSGPKGVETEAFTHFIGGMQKHLGAAVALFAPYVNSYRRYVPDFAAPINLEWGRDNRTTGIRVPISSAAARRVENRLPGMDTNPYLGIAATLAGSAAPILAARREPSAGGRRAFPQALPSRRSRAGVLPGLLLVGLAGVLVVLPAWSALPLAGYLSIALLLVAGMLLTPSIGRRVFQSVEAALRRTDAPAWLQLAASRARAATGMTTVPRQAPSAISVCQVPRSDPLGWGW
jgi:hypothetical protein